MSVMGLRKELIHLAAVAVATIEDLDCGRCNASVNWRVTCILGEIRDERTRQDRKWGVRHQDKRDWVVILGEEYGEVCKEVLELLHLDTPRVISNGGSSEGKSEGEDGTKAGSDEDHGGKGGATPKASGESDTGVPV